MKTPKWLRLPSPEEDPREMTFLEHLEELRWVLIRSGIVVLLAAVVMWTLSDWIYQQVLLRPLQPIMDELPSLRIVTLRPAGLFLALLNISLWAAVLVSVPYLAWEIWRFVAPGLFKHERRLVPLTVAVTAVCFLAGAALAYFVVLPYALRFFLTTWPDLAEFPLEIREYLSFSMRLILSFGIIFELPILSFFLARIGVLSPDLMRKGRAYGYFIIALLSAFITPPDPMTMVILMGPLVLLYEVSIWVAAAAARRHRKKLPKSP